MAVKVYEYPKCSTCRKALKFLDGRGISYKKMDIVLTPPSKADLKRMVKYYDGDFTKLFNTSGVVYRSMKLSQKVKSMTESEAIELLASNGMLVKRPFLLTEDVGLLGFREEQWKSELKK